MLGVCLIDGCRALTRLMSPQCDSTGAMQALRAQNNTMIIELILRKLVCYSRAAASQLKYQETHERKRFAE